MVEILSVRTDDVENCILKSLSSSHVCGIELRKSHYYLGSALGEEIQVKRALNNLNLAVLIMMRAGLPFGLGLADKLEKNNNVTIIFSNSIETKDDYSKYDVLIVADAVINTGKSILEQIRKTSGTKIIIATNVISEKYINLFETFDVFAVRVSSHSFKGARIKKILDGKGPDTGDRLFCSSFYSDI